MSAREAILGRVRSALKRENGGPPPSPPPVRLRTFDQSLEDRITTFCTALETLAGKTYVAASHAAARDYVLSVVNGRTYMTSGAPILRTCGLAAPALADRHRMLASEVEFGISSANYALADTGTLVLFAGSAEARLISLLPPVHIAVIDRQQILPGLDELLTRVPMPADLTSAMVLVTGPSRTADIEQILVRGVHGPGELHVVIV